MATENTEHGLFARLIEGRIKTTLWLLDNMIWPVLILAFIAFGILLPEVFLSGSNVTFIMYSAAATGTLALAESLCLLTGKFDLSVGSIAGFSAMFTALFITEWFPGAPGVAGIAIILLVGGAIGFLNGFSIAYLGVSPFLQTLSFFIIFRGGVSMLSTLSVSGFNPAYSFIGGGQIGPVPVAIPITLILFSLFWFMLKYTRFGLGIYAVGGDEDAASEAGINTNRLVLIVFITSGMLSGLAGLFFTGYIGAATPGLADGAIFQAFAAAVIGGISLFGGRGNIFGAFGGVLLLTMFEVALVQLQVDPTAIQTVNGIILLGAILLYTFESKLRTRILTE